MPVSISYPERLTAPEFDGRPYRTLPYQRDFFSRGGGIADELHSDFAYYDHEDFLETLGFRVIHAPQSSRILHDLGVYR